MSQFQKDVISFLRLQYGKALAEADATEIYHSVSAAAMCQARKNWGRLEEGKKVCYFSAEFLVGRLVSGNLVNLGLADQTEELLRETEWMLPYWRKSRMTPGKRRLGPSGGLLFGFRRNPRHCMNGYGIRYRYGLFRQSLRTGSKRRRLTGGCASGSLVGAPEDERSGWISRVKAFGRCLMIIR